MPARFDFFAVHADDPSRAEAFYQKTFGWKFRPWGSPGFLLTDAGENDRPYCGALQQRHEVVPGERFNGLECTFLVGDIEATAKAVVANGGKIIMPVCEIPTVGRLIKFQDTEGNLICAKQPFETKK